jgi:hypothetical protein
MLAVARRKIPPGTTVRLVQTGAAELIDHFPRESFDTIVSILMFSELSDAEQRLVLRQCCCLLGSNDHLILADEVRAPTLWRRIFRNLLRAPLSLITYVLTQASTSPVGDLKAKLSETGFGAIVEERNRLGSFAVMEAVKARGVPAMRDFLLDLAQILLRSIPWPVKKGGDRRTRARLSSAPKFGTWLKPPTIACAFRFGLVKARGDEAIGGP